MSDPFGAQGPVGEQTHEAGLPDLIVRGDDEGLELQVISGADRGLKAGLHRPVVRIGTAVQNDFVLSDRTVSRFHAEIRRTPRGWIIRDLGSTNGTRIDALPVAEAYLIPGSKWALGHSEILIRRRADRTSAGTPEQNRLGPLVGTSERLRALYRILQAVAPTLATVLIAGESGSGKELVARTLHALSGRPGPLVVFDASVTDPEWVRNDLCGHLKGAFTGATGSREGAFRRADRGTLFIDEIGELPLELQPRLLRALENREITPIGSDRPVRVDVRVVAATHRDLAAMVRAGDFRADLYYRLCVIPVRTPALREIPEDIPLLVRHFLDQLALPCRVSPQAMEALKRHPWPGNVRELRNVLERAAALCGGREIRPEDLHLSEEPTSKVILETKPPIPSPASLDQIKDLERAIILQTLARRRNNKAATARELGIPIATLWRKLKAYQADADPPVFER